MRGKALALLATLVFAHPALANQAYAPSAPATKASASLQFRIVIPETIQMQAHAEPGGRVRRFVTRSSELRAGRMVVTIAKP